MAYRRKSSYRRGSRSGSYRRARAPARRTRRVRSYARRGAVRRNGFGRAQTVRIELVGAAAPALNPAVSNNGVTIQNGVLTRAPRPTF